ncbi:MAG: methyltransferase [Acetobacteraceae bacterium]|nr:methyltransferase [Acetobacteraceae bacterium]
MKASEFIRAHTAQSFAPLVPEIKLYLASQITPIWYATEEWLATLNLNPPFWAFAWPGGQALARYLLDNPALVRGKRVLDFAAGCGVAAIAAALSGGAQVEAAEIDELAIEAIRLNAAANGARVATFAGDLVGEPCRWDLILCGDVCYEAAMVAHILPWFRSIAGAAEVWIADPGRAHLPARGLVPLASLTVPTTLELEDRLERQVTIYRLVGG